MNVILYSLIFGMQYEICIVAAKVSELQRGPLGMSQGDYFSITLLGLYCIYTHFYFLPFCDPSSFLACPYRYSDVVVSLVFLPFCSV